MRCVLQILLLGSLVGGCALDGDITDDPTSAPGTIGVNLNGSQLNGVRLNGVRLNGVRLNGVRLNGVRLNGVQLNGVRLNGSQLTGVDGTTALTGSMLIGSQFSGVLSDGTTSTLRIDDAHTLLAPNQDVWAYKVSFLDSNTWFPACGVDGSGVPIEAIAVAGLWDYSQGTATGGARIADSTSFTLACRGLGAIAKCVEMGYKPWLPSATKQVCGTSCVRTAIVSHSSTTYTTTCTTACSNQVVSYADLHQACTRMIRADYCGDGTAYTYDGVTIDVYDGVGIQRDEVVWALDAEWGTAGARCFGPTETGVTAGRLIAAPSCTERQQLNLYPFYVGGCGDPAHFLGGTLLIDEARPVKIGI